MVDIAKKATKKSTKSNGEYKLDLDNAALLDIYYYMMLTRSVENKVFSLYRQGKIVGGVYSGMGMEAGSVGASYALMEDDILFPAHRDMGAHLVRGETLRRMFCQFLGKANGPTRGTDSNMHMGYPEKRIFGPISHLGSMVPVAAGAAYAEKIRGNNVCAMTFIGDGATSIGEVHEGLNMASVMGVGLVVVIENNQYAYSTPNDYQYKCENLIDRAIGYGMPGILVEDGNDVLAVYKAARQAVLNARAGNGPTLIEVKTMRMRGHSAHENNDYIEKEKLDEWSKNDPLERYESYLKGKKVLTRKKKKDFDDKIQTDLNDAIDFAESSPYPRGSEAAFGVFAK